MPAPKCKTEHEVLTTQSCVPFTENVCETKTVETEEIEYEKVCKEVVETLCDQPAYGYHDISKREAEAEADAYTIGQVAYGLPVHNAIATGHAHNVGVVTGYGYGGYGLGYSGHFYG